MNWYEAGGYHKTERIRKSLDNLSRTNRIFTDNLVKLIYLEIKAKTFDITWYDVQLPKYSGMHKGEFTCSNKSKIDITTSRNMLSIREIHTISYFIVKTREKKLSDTKIRIEISSKLFNESTTSCLN